MKVSPALLVSILKRTNIRFPVVKSALDSAKNPLNSAIRSSINPKQATIQIGKYHTTKPNFDVIPPGVIDLIPLDPGTKIAAEVLLYLISNTSLSKTPTHDVITIKVPIISDIQISFRRSDIPPKIYGYFDIRNSQDRWEKFFITPLNPVTPERVVISNAPNDFLSFWRMSSEKDNRATEQGGSHEFNLRQGDANGWEVFVIEKTEIPDKVFIRNEAFGYYMRPPSFNLDQQASVVEGMSQKDDKAKWTIIYA